MSHACIKDSVNDMLTASVHLSPTSGIAGPLAAWCGGHICCCIVLGFWKWIACLKPRVLMPKVTCSIYSILVSSLHTRVCWYNGFLCNYQCSIAVIKLQFSPICRPLASVAWCSTHSHTLSLCACHQLISGSHKTHLCKPRELMLI